MKTKKINIALIGLGNIGSYFYKSLNRSKNEISIKTGKFPLIKYVSAKNKNKKRSYLKKTKWINNPLDLVAFKDVDIVVELVGGDSNFVKKIVEKALINKKHVITANKSLIASYGNHLSKLAEDNCVNLEYEASVGGGIPVIRSLKEGLIGNEISKVRGILNGTSNFILSQMEKTKKSLKEIINEAKLKGYAETNPKSDLNGGDVASKIRILSSICFNKLISHKKILINGIQRIQYTDIVNAKNLGYKIKLLGISEVRQNKLFERVYPALVDYNSYIGNTDGILNAIVINGSPVGQALFQGEGAGQGPTTSALISDLCSILRGNVKYPFGVSYKLRKKIKTFNFLDYKCSGYLRIEVVDKYGVLSSITNNFAKNKISIKRVIQIPKKKNKTASIVIITHKSYERNYINCINFLKKKKFVLENPVYIRIENI